MHEYDPVTVLKGIGPRKAQELALMGIDTIQDLLEYFPRTYIDRGSFLLLSDVSVGAKLLTKAVFTGKTVTQYISRRLTVTRLVFIQQGKKIDVVFYNQPYRKNHFIPDTEYVLHGVVLQRNGAVFLSSPDCERSDQAVYLREGIAPVYTLPTKSGITKKVFYSYLLNALDHTEIIDSMPFWIHSECELPDKETAYRDMHFSSDIAAVESAMNYFRLIRFLRFFLLIGQLNQQKKSIPAPMLHQTSLNEWTGRLGFDLTDAQLRAIDEIAHDLESGNQMNRLLQGDVGSGKTAVAMTGAFICASCGYQAVFTAPTEILAKQHFQKYRTILSLFGIESIVLHSSLSARDRKEALDEVRNGTVRVIFGTHAVFSEDVEYRNLAFITIDEQHRFGVAQRAKLASKGNNPHVLVMSATPIPRTLSLSMYRDLNLSVLDTVPAGRKSVKTIVCGSAANDAIDRLILKETKLGHKCYIVCPAAEDEGMQNVAQLHEEIKKKFPKIKSCALTGSMAEKDKNRIMNEFAFGDVMILVATTVIEVGVDVAEATVIVIKDSERFGLAQLHQLRGRVGRSDIQSYCILQSDSVSETSVSRLNILKNTNDGFEIARADMRLRGSGEIFGLKQSGNMSNIIYEALQNEKMFRKAELIVQTLQASEQSKDKVFLEWLSEGVETDDTDIIFN